MDQQERAAVAREIIDANLYMTLATADREGRPWASPVYYRATATEHSIIGPGIPRAPVSVAP